MGVGWSIGQSDSLDLENILHLGFEGLLRPCWGFDGLELLNEIFLDSNSIQAIIKSYNPPQKGPVRTEETKLPSSVDLSVGTSWLCI